MQKIIHAESRNQKRSRLQKEKPPRGMINSGVAVERSGVYGAGNEISLLMDGEGGV